MSAQPNDKPSNRSSKDKLPNDSKANSTTTRKGLPFEPQRTKAKVEKKAPPSPSPNDSGKTSGKASGKARTSATQRRVVSTGGIPEVVSRRMVKRMALFCGIPTALGVSSFFISYYVVINELLNLPTVAVLFVSLGFFGIGVLGLSYGALSTSWDEENPGDWLGWREFKVNFGRMRQAWKEARDSSKV